MGRQGMLLNPRSWLGMRSRGQAHAGPHHGGVFGIAREWNVGKDGMEWNGL